MKILIVTGIFPPDLGGPANYVPTIAQALAKKHEIVSIVTLSDIANHDDSSFDFPVLRIKRHQNTAVRRILTIIAIANLARDVDLVYLNGLVFEGIFAAKVILRKPVAVKVVGDTVWESAMNKCKTLATIDEFQKPSNRSCLYNLLHWMQKTYTNAADIVITPSNYLHNIVSRWGVISSKIYTVYNSTSIPSQEVNKKIEFDVVSVARLVSWKGIDDLIRICALNNWKCLVIGEGPERSRLQMLVHKLNAPVTFAGSIPRMHVTDQIRRAKVFVLNSTYEGLPHVVLEAQLADRPVVATNVGGTSEIVKNGETGLLVKPGNLHELQSAISLLLTDENFYQYLVQSAKHRTIQLCSYECMIESTTFLLESIVKAGS